MVRLAVIAAIIGVVLVVGGIITFNNDIQSRRTPLNVDPYPGAVPWGQTVEMTSTSRSFFFLVEDATVEQVVLYYDGKLSEFDNSAARCVRIPSVGEIPIDPSIPDSIPFKYDCIFDRSGLNSTQYTQITIFPGRESNDPFYDNAGKTVINYQQVWQP